MRMNNPPPIRYNCEKCYGYFGLAEIKRLDSLSMEQLSKLPPTAIPIFDANDNVIFKLHKDMQPGDKWMACPTCGWMILHGPGLLDERKAPVCKFINGFHSWRLECEGEKVFIAGGSIDFIKNKMERLGYVIKWDLDEYQNELGRITGVTKKILPENVTNKDFS